MRCNKTRNDTEPDVPGQAQYALRGKRQPAPHMTMPVILRMTGIVGAGVPHRPARSAQAPFGTARNRDYIPMPMPPIPPMPPMSGMPPAGLSSTSSATMQSVVSIRPATEAAFCRAERVTLVGSSTPISTMSP